MRIISGLLVTAVITACTGGAYSESSPYFNIPVGTKVIVKQALKIYPNSARVYLQYGKVVTAAERDQYEHNCWLLSWKVKETNQEIKPDTFTVTKTQHTDFLVKGLPIKLASSIDTVRLASAGATAAEYTTELSIHSDLQPDIRRLVCSYWGDPGYGKHITLAEIKAVLGNIINVAIFRPEEGSYNSK